MCDAAAFGQCANGERCLPSARGSYEFQRADGGAQINCDPVNNSSECNTARGFRCTTLGVNVVCARPVTACGTAVGLANLLPLPDGGQRPIPLASVCNLGPSRVTLGSNIPADRFCDDLSNLPDPPDVTCRPLIIGAPVGIGLCVAVCRYPGAPPDTRSCPQNHSCNTVDSRILEWVTVGLNTVSCNVDADCSAHPEAVCMPGPTGAKFCFRKLGTCQPG